MKWLIVIGLVSIFCNSITINQIYAKKNKQKDRSEYFTKFRSDYPKNYLNVLNIYKTFSSSYNEKLLSTPSWNSIGPVAFKSKSSLNNGHGRVNCLALNPLDSNILWAGTPNGGLWIYNINDSSWKSHSELLFFSCGISSIAFAPSNPNIVYLATGDARGGDLFRGYSSGIFKSTDNGLNFNYVESINKNELIFIRKILVSRSNPHEIFIGTNRGLYFQNTLTDSTKLLIDYDYIADIEYHHFKKNIVYVSTSNNGTNFVYKSIDTGKTFERIFQVYNSTRVELSTLEFYPDHLFVLADGTKGDTTAQFFISTNSGSTFKNMLDKESSKKLVESQGSYNLTMLVNPRNKNLIYVGGVPLHRSIDGGFTWADVGSDVHVDQHDMIMDSESNIYLANDGGVFVSYNFGNTWEDISNGLNITQFYCVAGYDYHPNLVYGGSQDNGLIRFVPDNNYHILPGDVTDVKIAGEKKDKLFAVLNKGALYYSDDFGETFIGNNLTADIPEERTWKSPTYISPKMDTIIISFKNLWMSNDTGKTWTKQSNFDSNNDFITAISYVNHKKVFIAKDKDLFILENENLKRINTFNQIISSLLYFNNNIYLTFGNFDSSLKVLKIDENYNIDNLTSNLSNFPVNKIIFNSIDSSFYLATDFGVFMMPIKSSEWLSLGYKFGFPMVNDIDFNPVTRKLYAATFGRGIWELDFSNCNKESIKLNAVNEIFTCENSYISLTHNLGINRNLSWSNGELKDTILINKKQIYFGYNYDSSNCLNYSNIIKLNQYNKSSIKLVGLSKNPQCKGEPVYITSIANELDSCQFFWSNGAIGDTVELFEPGEYFAISKNKFGCLDTSENFNIYYVDNPPEPIIEYENKKILIKNSLIDFENSDIIWNINGIDSIYNVSAIIPTNYGEYYVKIISKNYCQSISNNIKIKKEDLDSDLNLSPTIVENNVNIEYFSTEIVDLSIKLFDEIGGELFSNSMKTEIGINKLTIDLSKYSQGLYIFEINYGNSRKFFKIIKVKN